MSILLFGDLHAHNWPRFSHQLEDGANSRLAQQLNVLDQIDDYIKLKKPHTLIFMGDLTHRRYFVQFSVLAPIRQKILELAYAVHETLLMVGNHDIEDKEGRYHSLSVFQGLEDQANIHVIDQPVFRRFRQSEQRFFACPYMTGNGVVEAVAQAAHSLVVQGREPIGLFHYSAEGKVLESDYMLPSVLTQEQLAPFRKVFFGHVHNPSEDDRLVYVGAPMHFDFGDLGQRYCVLYDEQTQAVEWLPLKYPKFVTTMYPKLPVKSDDGQEGFLRMLGVPAKEFVELKTTALECGWTEVVLMEEELPQQIQTFVAQHLSIDEGLLKDYVTRQLPDLVEADVQRVVDQGVEYIRKVEHQG